MDWETHKKELLKDPEVRKVLKEIEPEYQIARAIIKARIKTGLTQKQLALKLNTQQSVISRAEKGGTLPSLTFLKRLAKELNVSLHVSFE